MILARNRNDNAKKIFPLFWGSQTLILQLGGSDPNASTWRGQTLMLQPADLKDPKGPLKDSKGPP